MQFSSPALLLFVISALSIPHAKGDCPCGPTFCLETPGFAKALAEKKSDLAKEYPSRLISILDKASHCEACVRQGPDAFTLIYKKSDDTIELQAWDANNERIAATNLSNGKLKACRVTWLREAFKCCQQKPADQRRDWDRDLRLSLDMSVRCSASQ